MDKLRTVIVDDETLARRGLALRLQHLPQIAIVAECSNGDEALAAIAAHQPDLLFLDIQMPGKTGLDVVSELQSDAMPLVIFVTAFDQYALDAFRVHAIDYVLKPIDDDRLNEAVERAMEQHAQRQSASSKERLVQMVMKLTGNDASSVEQLIEGEDPEAQRPWPEKITLRDGNDIRFIKVAQIQWIDAAGDYMCIHAGGETHIMRITMKQLEALLDPAIFLRVHRSTIVNSGLIAGAQTLDNGEFLLQLEEGTKLKVSRSYRDRIRELLVTR